MGRAFKPAIGSAAALVTLATTVIAQADFRNQSSQHPPAITSATCLALRKIEVVNSTSSAATNSASYVDVPGAVVNFNTPKPGCVLATFSAPANAQNEVILVQMVLDSSPCLPSGTGSPNYFAGSFTSSNPSENANSMTYLCPDVQAGSHSIKAQYLSDFGNTVTLFGFTLTISHR